MPTVCRIPSTVRDIKPFAARERINQISTRQGFEYTLYDTQISEHPENCASARTFVHSGWLLRVAAVFNFPDAALAF